MSRFTQFAPGATVHIIATIRDPDNDNALFDPDTVTVHVEADRNGADLIAPAAMTKASAGVYHYDLQLPDDCGLGIYNVWVACAVAGLRDRTLDLPKFQVV